MFGWPLSNTRAGALALLARQWQPVAHMPARKLIWTVAMSFFLGLFFILSWHPRLLAQTGILLASRVDMGVIPSSLLSFCLLLSLSSHVFPSSVEILLPKTSVACVPSTHAERRLR